MLKFCPECGSEVIGGKFCGNCGANLTKYGMPTDSASTTLDDALSNLVAFAAEKQDADKRRAKEQAEAELKRMMQFFEHVENIDGTYTIIKVKYPELIVGNIVIPKGVTTIGVSAFRNCKKLINVILPEGLMFIDGGAFWDCSSLTSILIPNSVTSIGCGAFQNCSSLTIYCESKKQPSGWDSSWNNTGCRVIWGYKG